MPLPKGALHITVQPFIKRLSDSSSCVNHVTNSMTPLDLITYVSMTEPDIFVKRSVGRTTIRIVHIEIVALGRMSRKSWILFRLVRW